MLSTVVLPAPFGPIRLVTAPGSAVEATSVAALDAAEGDAEAADRQRPAIAPGAEEAGDVERVLRRPRACRCGARQRPSVPRTPSGASHSTTSSSAPNEQQPVLGEPRQQLGQHDARRARRPPARAPSRRRRRSRRAGTGSTARTETNPARRNRSAARRRRRRAPANDRRQREGDGLDRRSG